MNMKAKISANKDFLVGDIDNRIYGSFIEHLGRAVYGGIYEPDHPSADDCGFRQDVIDLVKELNVPIVRYPGGNFVSGYNWEDGTGEKSKRPYRMEQAWFSLETNEVGIDEFQEWAKRANTEVMMAVNLGTRGPDEARNCVEYCNSSTDTHYANLRRANGFEKPFGIKVWCLGNEMDGDWQIGKKTAEEYGRIAHETAKVMKWVDPSIELVACGSSSQNMSTFGEWELTVLDHTYDDIDYLSLHCYYANYDNDTPAFLAKAEEMDRFVKGAAAFCDAIKAKKHSKKTINLSFDEWNVWTQDGAWENQKTPWQKAPRLLEQKYTFEDALLVGCMLMVLQNNCDRVKMGCLAQLVNVIAPIFTENGGPAWVQTIFYPFMYASNFGRGRVMQAKLECDTYDNKGEAIPYIMNSVVDNGKGELIVYAVNRSLEDDIELELAISGYDGITAVEHIELYSDDIKAVNTKDNCAIKPANVPLKDKIVLKKHSWNMVRLQYK